MQLKQALFRESVTSNLKIIICSVLFDYNTKYESIHMTVIKLMQIILNDVYNIRHISNLNSNMSNS